MTKRKASVAIDASDDSHRSSAQENSSNSNSIAGTNNNQAISGSPPTGSGCSRKQVSDSNDSNSSKSKKERADNWSSAEIQILHRGIESRKDIFYGPPSQAAKKNRDMAWEAIVKEVNSVSTTPRSLSQVIKKFKNEKCRAKRKFNGDKVSLVTMNGVGVVTNNSSNNLIAQNPSSNQQQQLQLQQTSHHMTGVESMPPQPASINVVKLAPQNVSKTMIDLPGHVHPIQMPSDDMVLIVPEMDGLMSGINIVSDPSGHHHFQKSNNGNALGNQHTHHNQHTIQTINTGQGIVNGNMGSGMMSRTIQPGSMCSLVYSTGNNVCSSDSQITNSVPSSMSTSMNAGSQNLLHHRGSVDQGQGQQQQQQQQHQQHHHHQLQQTTHQSQQHQTQQHQQQHQNQNQQHQQQAQQTTHAQHPHQSSQSHLQTNPVISTGMSANGSAVNASGGVMESQLKNLLFNLLLKDGQPASPNMIDSEQDSGKQRNDLLAIIAKTLDKIETHLGKIASAAGNVFAQNFATTSGETGNVNSISSGATLNDSSHSNGIDIDINNNDGSTNGVGLPRAGSGSIGNQGRGE